MSTPAQAGFTEAFREARDAFGVPITIGETEVVGIVTESAIAKELKLGGYDVDADFTARVLLSDLPAVPTTGKDGTRCTYKEEDFRVTKVAQQPGHDVVELALKSIHR